MTATLAGILQSFSKRTAADHAKFSLVLHIVLCKNIHMATNLALDDRLIEEARRVGRHKTKREAVSAALAEYVRRRKQLRILDAFGTVDFDPKYDYKAERGRKRS
jgi:Arc/MetJ family transcription regulator